ncbi:MAG: prephenate dehydratase [Acidobacteria bacterium]|nr:prephenate dehydratase [Acidobacteriota bacterium]MBA3887977.1 prephenate dehydratase [Acidobacteriota bacterium]
MWIAFQGEPGAYSEAAARRLVPDAETVPCQSFEDVFAAVAAGRVSRGIVPMENSIGGSIHRNYDLLLEHDLHIVAEVELDVDHCLLARPGATATALKVVYSHPQALAQCEQYLRRFEGVEIVAVYDTAGSAKMVAESGRTDAGAIASRRAGELFGLEVLAEAIQDFASNITRFVVIGRAPAPEAEATKTSLVFTTSSTPGSLFKALSCFALRDINLSKLESRPIRGRAWEYMFYVDVDAARHAPSCARAITHLGEVAKWVRVLGSYRAWGASASAEQALSMLP